MTRRLFLLALAPLLMGLALIRPSNLVLPDLAPSPTPTYDSFVEPPLPPDPTDFELGRNLYWHWCMPCHGDRGQGLTDEFRLTWEPDHQDCWARGCHGGLPRDEGFPIPTVVPPLAAGDHLARFASLAGLDEYLTGTHPPQSPGLLKAEEYHALSVYLFILNDRSADPLTPTPTPVPIPVPSARQPLSFLLPVVLIPAALLLGWVLYTLRKKQG